MPINAVWSQSLTETLAASTKAYSMLHCKNLNTLQ